MTRHLMYRVYVRQGIGEALALKSEGTRLAVTQLTLDWSHTCALFNNGKVKCWDNDRQAQLGYGNRENLGDDPGEMPPSDVPLWGTLPD